MVKVLERPTIKISKEALKMGVVILGLDKYKEMEFARIKEGAPVHYLKGKAARYLDRLVAGGIRDYKEGKIKQIKSLADLRN